MGPYRKKSQLMSIEKICPLTIRLMSNLNIYYFIIILPPLRILCPSWLDRIPNIRNRRVNTNVPIWNRKRQQLFLFLAPQSPKQDTKNRKAPRINSPYYIIFL